MVKANVTPDAIKKILKQIAKTEKYISKVNATLIETYNTLTDLENSITKSGIIIDRLEKMLNPDATQKQTKTINLVHTKPTGDNTLD